MSLVAVSHCAAAVCCNSYKVSLSPPVPSPVQQQPAASNSWEVFDLKSDVLKLIRSPLTNVEHEEEHEEEEEHEDEEEEEERRVS